MQHINLFPLLWRLWQVQEIWLKAVRFTKFESLLFLLRCKIYRVSSNNSNKINKNTKNNHYIGQLKQSYLNLQQLTSFSYLKNTA